MFFFHIR